MSGELDDDLDGTDAIDREALDAPTVNWDAVALAARLRGMPSTFVAIASESGVSESTLRNWANDRVATPSMRTVEALAQAFDVPRRFFLRSAPIPATSHLTFRRKSSRELAGERATLSAYASLVAVFARFLLGDNWGTTLTPDPLVELEPWRSGQVSARYLRARLGLGLDSPMPDLVELAESLGVLVVYGPAMPEGLDACSAVVERRRVVVVKRNDTDYFRQRWDIAHEIGHFVMGHDSAGREHESAANEFAEGLLFPWTMTNRRRLIGAVRDAEDLESLFNIQTDWSVSIDALLTTAKKQKIRGAQEKVDQLAAHRRTFETEITPAESPSILPNAADDVELHRNRPIEAIAKEEGFPTDMVKLMVSRTPPQ